MCDVREGNLCSFIYRQSNVNRCNVSKRGRDAGQQGTTIFIMRYESRSLFDRESDSPSRVVGKPRFESPKGS